eukprot:534406-Hanusia_phi.AAC.1
MDDLSASQSASRAAAGCSERRGLLRVAAGWPGPACRSRPGLGPGPGGPSAPAPGGYRSSKVEWASVT